MTPLLLSLALSTIAVDCTQSVQNISHQVPARGQPGMVYSEVNPLLVAAFGRRPTTEQFIGVGLGVSAALLTTTALLPDQWNWVPSAVALAVDLPMVAHNFSAGMSIRF